MEEHIFGTFSTDRLKALHDRAEASGVQHRARRQPRDPAPGEAVTLYATTGLDEPVAEVRAFFTTDGRAPDESSASCPFEPVGRRWHTLAWRYVTAWQATLPGQPDGTLLRYIVGARTRDGWRWADWPHPQAVVEEALVAGEGTQAAAASRSPSRFALSIDRFAPPAWAQEAVVYQIFLDRFARDDDAPWPQVDSLFDVHGGTLRGATAKLDHVRSLGATCVWLSPLFPSPTHHGYDATDFYAVEPRLGTTDDLRRFVREAHVRGIRVLLDFVPNHVSDQHPRFRAARADPRSPDRAWFRFDPSQPIGYRAFFGVPSMPELDTDHPAARDYLLGAAEQWLRDFDVDGFRLDYAHGPSHDFWAHFWRAVKRLKPDAWCFGEIVDTPDAQRAYEGLLDGVLDFHVGDALRRVFAHGTSDLRWLATFLRDHEAFFPPPARLSRPVFLDNHDMDRFLFAAGGEVARLRLAALVLYTLPHPPLLYYGTEVALPQRLGQGEGWGLEVSREPMDWARIDSEAELLRFFQRLGVLRRRAPAMRPQRRTPLVATADQWLVRLARDDHALLLALNRADAPTVLHHNALRGTFHDLLTDETLTLDGTLALDATAGRLLEGRE